MVGRRGIEPRPRVPKTRMLPIHHFPTWRKVEDLNPCEPLDSSLVFRTSALPDSANLPKLAESARLELACAFTRRFSKNLWLTIRRNSPNLVDSERIELSFTACKAVVLPLNELPNSGAGNRNRTCARLFTRQVLCQHELFRPWSGMRESNPRLWFGRPGHQPLYQSRP
jgi:hypothetical protein